VSGGNLVELHFFLFGNLWTLGSAFGFVAGLGRACDRLKIGGDTFAVGQIECFCVCGGFGLGFGLRLELGKISFHLVNLVVDIFLAQVEVVDLKSGDGANQDEANVEPLVLGGPYDSAVCDSKEAAYAP